MLRRLGEMRLAVWGLLYINNTYYIYILYDLCVDGKMSMYDV